MNRALRWTTLAAALAAPAFCAGASRPATTKGDAVARRAVDGILQREADGSEANRDRRLRAVRWRSPEFAPAQWQSGRVQLKGRWLSISAGAARLAEDRTLSEYRRLRDKTPRTLAGHLEMAHWCRKQKLFGHQRAHLTAALEIDPNHAFARKTLGFVRMGPLWVSAGELKRRQDEARQAARDLKRWGPKVAGFRDALAGENRLRYNVALKRLKEIDDPGAVAAIELGLAYESAELAMHVIEYLGEKKHRESTVALARQGVFSPWETTRKKAAECLKNRRYEDFVPQVLALTSTPLESRQVLYVDRRGSLFYRHVFGRETRDFKASGLVGFDQRALPVRRGRNQNRMPRALRTALNQLTLEEATLIRTWRIQEVSAAQEKLADELHRTVTEWNRSACSLLGTATGKAFADDATAWWRWWDAYTDTTQFSKSESKPEFQVKQYDFIAEPVPMYNTSSCLVAGTPVWTDRGLLAIDKVQIGDQVLSQNVETGELAWKPVLKATVRPKKPLIALEIGPRTVRMTPGHPFWVAGKGWVKARDIKTGMFLHDVTGTTAVRPAGDVAPEPTYNLIVADFHTYFVGETKVLSHDNTLIEPTNALVPGLARP